MPLGEKKIQTYCLNHTWKQSKIIGTDLKSIEKIGFAWRCNLPIWRNLFETFFNRVKFYNNSWAKNCIHVPQKLWFLGRRELISNLLSIPPIPLFFLPSPLFSPPLLLSPPPLLLPPPPLNLLKLTALKLH